MVRKGDRAMDDLVLLNQFGRIVEPKTLYRLQVGGSSPPSATELFNLRSLTMTTAEQGPPTVRIDPNEVLAEYCRVLREANAAAIAAINEDLAKEGPPCSSD